MQGLQLSTTAFIARGLSHEKVSCDSQKSKKEKQKKKRFQLLMQVAIVSSCYTKQEDLC